MSKQFTGDRLLGIPIIPLPGLSKGTVILDPGLSKRAVILDELPMLGDSLGVFRDCACDTDTATNVDDALRTIVNKWFNDHFGTKGVGE